MAGNYSNTGSWVQDIHSRPGLRNVSSYQISGTPFVTGSAAAMTQNTEVKISFPYVTKNVVINHKSGTGTLYVAFQSASAGNVVSGLHYLVLENNTFSIDGKLKEIYITSKDSGDNKYQLIAQLTNIPTQSMFHLTGSGITE